MGWGRGIIRDKEKDRDMNWGKKEYLELRIGSLITNRYSNLKHRLPIKNYDNLTISCEI